MRMTLLVAALLSATAAEAATGNATVYYRATPQTMQREPKTAPTGIVIPAVENAAPGVVVVSSSIRPGDFDIDIPISVTGGISSQISVDAGATWKQNATLSPGGGFLVRQTASAQGGASSVAQVTVGTAQPVSWTVKTTDARTYSISEIFANSSNATLLTGVYGSGSRWELCTTLPADPFAADIYSKCATGSGMLVNLTSGSLEMGYYLDGSFPFSDTYSYRPGYFYTSARPGIKYNANGSTIPGAANLGSLRIGGAITMSMSALTVYHFGFTAYVSNGTWSPGWALDGGTANRDYFSNYQIKVWKRI